MIEEVFISLIQVSLGKRVSLGCRPSGEEWRELFELSVAHALVGVCFEGVSTLSSRDAAGSGDLADLPADLYYDWAYQCARIEARNERMNTICVQVQSTIGEAGFRNGILKGQGIGSLYRRADGTDMSMRRQSGDIDVYVEGGMRPVMDFVSAKWGQVRYDYINAHVPFCEETEVELHWRARNFAGLFRNRRLQRWLDDNEQEIFAGQAPLAGAGSVTVPSTRFNRFYILAHIYGHMFSEGVGLRQIMDYYYVLVQSAPSEKDRADFIALLERFGLLKFGRAIMWVVKRVFMVEDRFLLCEADGKEGSFLLKEILRNGNFGRSDTRIRRVSDNVRIQYVHSILKHDMLMFFHYPLEFFSAPVWMAYHFIWKRTSGRYKFN